ncbi:MAG: hypothetical protein JWO42_2014 [Chloroflexi bacterium]|nr:hypothetical protein [Chloroflexota bacterium]
MWRTPGSQPEIPRNVGQSDSDGYLLRYGLSSA